MPCTVTQLYSQMHQGVTEVRDEVYGVVKFQNAVLSDQVRWLWHQVKVMFTFCVLISFRFF